MCNCFVIAHSTKLKKKTELNRTEKNSQNADCLKFSAGNVGLGYKLSFVIPEF